MFYVSNLVMHAVVKQSKQILLLMESHIKMWMHSDISASVELLAVMESRFMYTHC